MIVAVDIGGTKVSAAVFVSDESTPSPSLSLVRSNRYRSADFSGLGPLLETFLQGEKPSAIAIGVAGPVVAGRAEVTNLPWIVSAQDLTDRVGCPVHLMNDLQAHGHGLGTVPSEHLVCLQQGIAATGNRALIAAGTGLGESILFWDGRCHRPSPSEGSHTNFGPETDEDIDLLIFLKKKLGRVSWERVVSGRDGFRNLLDFFAQRHGADHSELVQSTVGKKNIGSQICEAADQHDPLAVKVMETFVRLYGAEAGNLALKGLTIGGVYVAGGIAPKILPWMCKPLFLEGFCNKGRFRNLLAQIPVYLVKDPDLALRGAALYALWHSVSA